MNLKKYLGKNYVSRYIMIVISVIMNGLGLSILRISCMGTDPFSSMNYSISESTGVSLGMLIILVNAVLIVFCIKFLPSSIGFGTIANMVILGNSADMWSRVVTDTICVIIGYCIARPLGVQWELIGIGTIFMAFGTGPMIAWIRERIADPCYQKICGEKG